MKSPEQPACDKDKSSTGKALMLESSHFSFLGYNDMGKAFPSKPRPYRVLTGKPPWRIIEKAVYIPKTERFNGCLYDQELNRIDESCIFHGLSDSLRNFDKKSIDVRLSELPIFDGSAIYLGTMKRHYGHFLIESLARSWALLESSLGDTFVAHVRAPEILEAPYMEVIWGALGVRRERIRFFDRPTIIKRIVIPSPSFQARSHVYTAYKDTLWRIASVMLPKEFERTDQPLYVSRRLLGNSRRKHYGEEKLEEFMRSRGAQILHPQQETIDRQIQYFNRHRLILGITGSGMHNLAFSVSPTKSVQFCGDYINPNFFLVDACFGVQTSYCHALQKVQGAKLGLASTWFRRRYTRLARRLPSESARRGGGVSVERELDPIRAIGHLNSLGIFS